MASKSVGVSLLTRRWAPIGKFEILAVEVVEGDDWKENLPTSEGRRRATHPRFSISFQPRFPGRMRY